MKKNNFLFCCFGLALVLFSCEKTIDFKMEYSKPMIVLNSVISPNQRVAVKVEKSRSILDESTYFESLKDANVLLYENEKLVSKLEYAGRIDTFNRYLEYGAVKKTPYEVGNYNDTNLVIKPGVKYRVEVSKEGFDPVSSETIVPLPVKIDSMVVNMKKAYQEYSSDYFEINVQLNLHDPVDQENYYVIHVFKERGVEVAFMNNGYYSGYYGGSFYGGYYGNSSQDSFVDSIIPTDSIVTISEYNTSLFSTDPVLSNATNSTEILNTESLARTYFSDELINGKTYPLTFWTTTYRDVYTQFGEYLRIYVTIESISKELYNYYSTREQHGFATDNPFAEPVPVYSNINGGLGIFGSTSSSFTSGEIGKFPVDGKTYIDQMTYDEIYKGMTHSEY